MEYSMSIPEEILFDIFSWLPVKSLMRFRCISQYFNSLVYEPYFVDIHQCHSRIRTKLLVRQWDLVSKRNFYYTIEQNASHRRVHIEDYFDGLTNVIDLKGYFVECVNGLFCFWSCVSQVVVICNPSTRQVRFLPCIKHEYDGLGHGQFLFGYEPKDEVYKVVFVKRDEHDISAARCWIFSLGIDESSWKEIDRAPCCFYYGQECVCIKGVIYVSSGNSQEQNIIAFDLKGESFRIIALWKDALPHYFNLIEMEGKLGIVENNTMINGETINLWMLGNTGWERHVIIGFPMEGCPIEHCLSQTYGGKINIIFIAKVNQSCDTLSYLLCCYDVSRKSWTRREIINGGWIQHIYRWVETLYPLKHICIDANSTRRV